MTCSLMRVGSSVSLEERVKTESPLSWRDSSFQAYCPRLWLSMLDSGVWDSKQDPGDLALPMTC